MHPLHSEKPVGLHANFIVISLDGSAPCNTLAQAVCGAEEETVAEEGVAANSLTQCHNEEQKKRRQLQRRRWLQIPSHNDTMTERLAGRGCCPNTSSALTLDLAVARSDK